MDKFGMFGFPHSVGSLDRTHIHIQSYQGRAAEFVIWKSNYSVLLQGMTNYSGHFIDVEIGYSGRNHDAYVFNSQLCAR